VVPAAEAAGGTGRRFSGDAALRELARRYLLGYGPAGVADLAAWSGLPMATARRAFDLLGDPDGAAGRAVTGLCRRRRGCSGSSTRCCWASGSGFRAPAEHAKRVNAGGGMIAATLLVDGRVAGLWRRAGRKVTLQPFDGPSALAGEVRDALEADVEDLSRFLGARLTGGWG